jgi:hypothetical protein
VKIELQKKIEELVKEQQIVNERRVSLYYSVGKMAKFMLAELLK